MLNENGQKVDESRDILQEIAAFTRQRVRANQEKQPVPALAQQARTLPKGDFAFERALRQPQMSFICEIKKASPSKGVIAPDFPYVEIAKDYQAAGATAISCLTEPQYFQGSDQYLREIANEVRIPILRKDFTVDPYMVYEAKIMGASAILLICAMLSDAQLRDCFQVAEELGLSTVFEAHNGEEVQRALACGARIVGVNNRNLRTFAVDLQTSINLRKLVPEDVLFISESGIKTRDDIVLLQENQVDAVLIGETFMRASDKKEQIARLKGMV